MRNRYLVAYDVSDDRRLRKIFKTMRGFGDPVQYSVFRCDLSRKEKALMVARVAEIIKHDEDTVMVVDLGPVEGRGGEESIEILGRTTPPPVRRAVIV